MTKQNLYKFMKLAFQKPLETPEEHTSKPKKSFTVWHVTSGPEILSCRLYDLCFTVFLYMEGSLCEPANVRQEIPCSICLKSTAEVPITPKKTSWMLGKCSGSLRTEASQRTCGLIESPLHFSGHQMLASGAFKLGKAFIWHSKLPLSLLITKGYNL